MSSIVLHFFFLFFTYLSLHENIINIHKLNLVLIMMHIAINFFALNLITVTFILLFN